MNWCRVRDGHRQALVNTGMNIRILKRSKILLDHRLFVSRLIVCSALFVMSRIRGHKKQRDNRRKRETGI
jgi:hypothetical protein